MPPDFGHVCFWLMPDLLPTQSGHSRYHVEGRVSRVPAEGLVGHTAHTKRDNSTTSMGWCTDDQRRRVAVDPREVYMSKIAGILAALATVFATAAAAAPVTYSFTTGADPLGGVASFYLTGGASGTFMYDSSALAVSPLNVDGSTNYRGFGTEHDTGFVTTVSNLSATVGAFTFSDLAGSTTVGNDNFGVGAVDSLLVNFEPAAGAPASFARNLSGFDMGGALLVNVHMLWTEGQANPEVIADFLTNQDLPGVLPSF